MTNQGTKQRPNHFQNHAKAHAEIRRIAKLNMQKRKWPNKTPYKLSTKQTNV